MVAAKARIARTSSSQNQQNQANPPQVQISPRQKVKTAIP